MALPKAVQQIGDAAEAAAVNAGIKPGSKPTAATIAGEQSAVTIAPEPAKPVKKIDPDDWKERFTSYKKATDKTITDLRDTLADTQSTLAQVQRQNQDLLTKLSTPSKQPETEQPTANAEDAAYQSWYKKLPENIKNDYTDEYLRDQFVIQTNSASKPQPNNELEELRHRVQQSEQFREKTEAQLYEEAMDDAYPNDAWINMTQEADWAQFCKQPISEIDRRTFGEIVKQGSESHTARTVIWVLKQYEQHKSTLEAENHPAGGDDPLESHLTPEGAGGGGDPVSQLNAKTQTFTLSQVNDFFKDVATGKKYTAEEATAIEKQIIAAQAAGKIIPG